MENRNAVVMAVLCLALSPSAGSATFSVSPMELHLAAQGGTRQVEAITVTNDGEAPLTLKLYLADSRLMADGTEENLQPGTLARSCATWVTLGNEVLELGPNETARVSVATDVPKDADGSHWAKIYVEEISAPQPSVTRAGDRTYQVFLVQRMGIRVFQDVPGTEQPDARITNVDIGRDEDSHSRVLVSVQNTGNTLLRCSGYVEIRDSVGAVSESLPLGTEGRFTVFPEGARDLTVALPANLAPGTYTGLAIVDFGGDHLVAGDAVFRVTAEGILPGIAGPEPSPPDAKGSDQQ